MPELPEAETIRSQLEAEVVGAAVRRVKVLSPRAARENRSAAEVARLSEGRRIVGVGRRGKAVVLFLDGEGGETSLVIRLGMTGLVELASGEDPVSKHTAAIIELDDGRQIRFVDQRKFGLISARKGHDLDALPEFAGYGPEPLSDQFSPEYLEQALSRRSAHLEPVLMDQKVVAGIGKIYADEICFRAGLRPTRPANSLTRPMRERLWQATREVLQEAIRYRGTSAADETYRDLHGRPGEFTERLQVYQRTGQPCRVCGTPIRRTPMAGGRGMHWCPRCQR